MGHMNPSTGLLHHITTHRPLYKPTSSHKQLGIAGKYRGDNPDNVEGPEVAELPNIF